MILRALLYIISGFLPCRLIHRAPGEPYLERYYLGSFAGRYFYLHRFVDADGDDAMHDHPWARAWSVVLTGGYIESRACMAGRYRDRWKDFDCMVNLIVLPDQKVQTMNRLSGDCFHQIKAIKPGTWTLFWHTGWEKSWGFVEPVTGPSKLANEIMDIRTFGYRKHVGAHRRDWWRDPACRRGWNAGREPFAPFNSLFRKGEEK